jgi:L-amino acid N-acyltransferase YncA
MNERLEIRLANKSDCTEILNIYRHYVLNSAITFEYDVPSLDEMESRMMNTQMKYPYLVAAIEGKIIGYVYATDFRHRAAYQWSPESTVYLHKDFKGQGIGRILYQKLIGILKLQGYYNVFGGVALPNDASISLHLKLGFEEIGTYRNIGYKNGKWHSTCWFQLGLNNYSHNPEVPKSIKDITLDALQSILGQ